MTSERDALLNHGGRERKADYSYREQIYSRGFAGVLLLCGTLFLVAAVAARLSPADVEERSPVQQLTEKGTPPARDCGREAVVLGDEEFGSTLAPVHVSTAECTGDTSKPVVLGADVVAYRSLQPGSHAEMGSPKFSSLFGAYTFYFSSLENKLLFERDPVKYLPAWGGFCSYGISSEIIWNGENLGPPANPDFWMVVDDQLYLFRSATPFGKFQTNMEKRIAHGNSLWESWWGDSAADATTTPFNTGCFCTEDTCEDG